MSSFLEMFEKKIKNIIKLNAFIGLITTSIVGGGIYSYYHAMEVIRTQGDKQNLILIAMEKQGLPGRLLKVVDEKMGDKAPVEVKVDVTNTILMMCSAKGIPVYIACGLIEVESGWNPKAISSCGAKGLTQVMASTAKPYLRVERKSTNSDELYNPVTSVIVGLSYLADLQAQYVELEVTEPNDFTYALHNFFWGGQNTAILLSKKDIKASVPNMAYPIRVLEASKKYKLLGL